MFIKYMMLCCSLDGNIMLDSRAIVTLTDIEAENGVVHVINQVLMPMILDPIVG